VQTLTDKSGNVTTYTYDSVGRLHQAEAKTSGGTLIDRWTYTFDNASNRTRVDHTTSSGTTTTSYGYNNDNVLCWRYSGISTNACASPPAGASTYSSDASGNLTSGPSSFNAVYDVANRLTTFAGNSINYLSPTNTESVSIGGTTLTNNMLGLGAQTTAGSTTAYTRAPDGSLLAQRSAAGTQYVLDDNIGSTRGLVSGTSVVRDYAYDPDGNATSSGSGATTELKFAGGFAIPGGLYHFGQRYYDPGTARWTQPDPVSQFADLGQANRYPYAAGDPVNWVDPSGLGIWDDVDEGVSELKTIAGETIKGAGTGGAIGLLGGCALARQYKTGNEGCVVAGGAGATLGGLAGAGGGFAYGTYKAGRQRAGYCRARYDSYC